LTLNRGHRELLLEVTRALLPQPDLRRAPAAEAQAQGLFST